MSKPKAQPPLTHRVGALEAEMIRVNARLEPLSSLPQQVLELRTLLQSTLDSQQHRQDEAEARAIEESEERRALASALGAQGREFALLRRKLGRLVCLDADPVIPCPSDKER
jgi:hypothetical protein